MDDVTNIIIIIISISCRKLYSWTVCSHNHHKRATNALSLCCLSC